MSVHQAFWEVMDALDRDTWVLEPEKPTPGCNYRRIVVCKATTATYTYIVYNMVSNTYMYIVYTLR